MTIAILSLQGDFALHRRMLECMGVAVVEAHRGEHLNGIDGIIIPGGETITMHHILNANDFGDKLQGEIRNGLPVWGTCAGAILLGHGDDRPQPRWNLIDVHVKRNAYGRQVDSFVADLGVKGFDTPFPAVFIRAPRFIEIGDAVETLAELEGEPVLARHGNILISSFHPELTDDLRIHRLFIEQFCSITTSNFRCAVT